MKPEIKEIKIEGLEELEDYITPCGADLACAGCGGGGWSCG